MTPFRSIAPHLWPSEIPELHRMFKLLASNGN
jgi:hypothetical protein